MTKSRSASATTVVTVTAWGLTGGGSTFETAQLGRFGLGMHECAKAPFAKAPFKTDLDEGS